MRCEPRKRLGSVAEASHSRPHWRCQDVTPGLGRQIIRRNLGYGSSSMRAASMPRSARQCRKGRGHSMKEVVVETQKLKCAYRTGSLVLLPSSGTNLGMLQDDGVASVT